ncbi:MAG: hypothetical protein M1834_000995 [Cirrosporium novae-zelandiae]|nr:MAG: hypothetical protein M1834_000995 [Cirrosporium novae-zelandiae]
MSLSTTTTSSSSYKAEFPTHLPINPSVLKFLEKFYEISDNPNAHDTYVNSFTDDATFKLGSKIAQGTSEIKSLRASMWEYVKSRKHTIHKVFPFGSDALEVMLYGDVEYELKKDGSGDGDGGVRDVKEWAGRAVLRVVGGSEGEVKLGFYQVYI